MDILPLDTKNKIMSYLPINSKDIKQLHREVRRHREIMEVMTAYKSHWILGGYENEGIDWLSNNVSRWLNDDVATLERIIPKYEYYASEVFKVSRDQVNNSYKLSAIESQHSSKNLCFMYLNNLNNGDFEECIKMLDELLLPF
jgi:hypothetical protein